MLESLVKKSKGRISPQDAAAETGFSIGEVQDGLSRLLELYEARVIMDENSGLLTFVFNYPLKLRGRKTFKELLLSFFEVFWKVFKLVYKASIGVILIIYTVIFVILLLLIIARGGSDDRKGNPVGEILGGIFRAIFEGMRIAAWTGVATEFVYDGSGNRYKRYKPEPKKEKKFIQSVYQFVLGPERPPFDPLNDAKEAAAFIRQNEGQITAGDIVVLSGVTYPQAESRLAEYAGKFKGELSIDADGVVIAEFPDMLFKVSPELEGGKIEYYTNEVEPPYELTGNTAGRNTGIIFMNLFNLIMSLVGISYFSYDVHSTALMIALGAFPLVFSILFILIPIFRIPFVSYYKNKRKHSLMRKRLVGAFSRTPGKSISVDDILKLASVGNEEIELAKSILNKLVIDLEGEINIDEQGVAVVSFPRLARELKI